MTIRKAVLIIIGFLFLFPITAGGMSVNYSYIMLPLSYLIVGRNVKNPNKLFYLLIGLFTIIFIVASVYQYKFYDEGFRRIVSFLIFMSMFSYMFINIDAEMIEAFKISIVAISLYFSLLSLFKLINLDIAVTAGTDAKVLVGGQRFGFIYIIGIWLTYFYQARRKLYVFIKYIILLILLVGLLLTFSKSSIVALCAGYGVYVLMNCLRWLKKPNLKMLWKGMVTIVIACLLIISSYKLVPIAFNFFDTYMFSSSVVETVDLDDPETSAGTRVLIVEKIVNFIIDNPLIGSGYLGVWILSNELFGSAHNQYTDVLFRTGLFGFIAYIYLLYLLVRYLFVNDRALFWGAICVLIYGMFHEVFKDSHGGFVLAFLFGMMSQSMRRTNEYKYDSLNMEVL